jgi:two-component system response regulator HydG
VVDDHENMQRLLVKVLRGDAVVHTAGSGDRALELLEQHPISVIVCDLRLPDTDGLELLRASKRLPRSTEFILITAYASVPTAIEAMRDGAYDYVTKPFEPETLRAVVLRALTRSTVPRATSPSSPPPGEALPGLVGCSTAMRQLAQLVQRVAESDATALVLGETGTGKERVARAIHSLSPRSKDRFVAINCAAIPAELLESELFGHARGAFTGATKERGGLFEEAHQGTLFMDEIGEMRPSLQAKLTRAVEERAVRRLGESWERDVNVRLVAATHRDLEAMVRQGTFREDLWYRLNVAVVRVPPLRDRKEDIELLATHFLRERSSLASRPGAVSFSEAALAVLRLYDWPGNVRQLQAAVERAAIEAPSERIEVEHLPPEIKSDGSKEGVPTFSELGWQEAMEQGRREVGQRYLRAVLARHGGRVAEAAEHAGVERESFYRLLRKHGVRPDGDLED